MSDRLKRISYSILLDPLNIPADRFASKVLHEWADKITSLASSAESSLEIHDAKAIHKQVYLSGMFLHLLNPELSSRLSIQLTDEQITVETLLAALESLGLHDSTASQTTGTGMLNADSLAKMEEALTEHIKLESQLTREQLNEQHEQSSDARDDTIADIVLATKGQNDHLIDIVKSQATQLTDLKSLVQAQTQLIQSLSLTSSSSTVTKPANSDEKTPVIDLNERLAHVQKIKKKGIF